MGRSLDTVQRATKELVAGRWIEVRHIGQGALRAYVLNDRVVFHGDSENKRYSLFSAAVIVSSDDQPDEHELGQQPPLRTMPTMFPGEQQLPAGPGLDPPSQPSIPGMEPDLPAIQIIEGGKS